MVIVYGKEQGNGAGKLMEMALVCLATNEGPEMRVMMTAYDVNVSQWYYAPNSNVPRVGLYRLVNKIEKERERYWSNFGYVMCPLALVVN